MTRSLYTRLLTFALLSAGMTVRADIPAGEPGGVGLAILTQKALVVPLEGAQVINHAMILVREGLIEAVGPQSEMVVPSDYEILDVGSHWVCPGFIDLHCHIAGTYGLNDTVYQTNPGLRISPETVPGNPRLKLAVAGGVSTVLFLPGSGSNMGGQGVLLKTGVDEYEAMEIRNPGSLKIAQGDNPKRWAYGMGRIMMAWNLREDLSRGKAYAAKWEVYERDGGVKPKRDIRLDVFRDLAARKTQISTHTQYYRLVLTTIIMLAKEFGFATYIDHGSFDSYLATPLAIDAGVAAILGPRQVMWPRPPRFDTDGQVHGSAWGFQKLGHKRIGFNTDAPVVPQEELSLQAAMGVRYGMDDSNADGVRGLTCIPAVTSGLENKIGSIEPGLDADLLIVTGDPVDPRTSVEAVYQNGRRIYDTQTSRRRW